MEKETRIRESMFMMGLSQWVLWCTWYLKQFVFLFISVLAMAILIVVGFFLSVYECTQVIRIKSMLLHVMESFWYRTFVSVKYYNYVWKMFDVGKGLVGSLSWQCKGVVAFVYGI